MSFLNTYLELLLVKESSHTRNENLMKYFDDWIRSFPGDDWHDKVQAARDTKPTVFNKLLNALNIHRDKSSVPPTHYYIRFGNIPKDDISGVHYGGQYSGYNEKGLSVYPAKWSTLHDKWEILDGDDQYIAGYSANRNSRKTILLLTGEELNSIGEDGEPLLKPGSIKKVTNLQKTDFYMAGVEDPSELYT